VRPTGKPIARIPIISTNANKSISTKRDALPVARKNKGHLE